MVKNELPKEIVPIIWKRWKFGVARLKVVLDDALTKVKPKYAHLKEKCMWKPIFKSLALKIMLHLLLWEERNNHLNMH